MTIGNRQSAIGNRQSAIGNRQSAIGNRQSAISNQQSAIGVSRIPPASKTRQSNSSIKQSSQVLANPYPCGMLYREQPNRRCVELQNADRGHHDIFSVSIWMLK
ncbi:hypothetical protein AAH450_06875 [Erwinia sp. P7711]|uniref:hypothetical protein n=1 Tax=Erwinia sp. P7711 TaxID=3141451 RepID=UPI003185731E